MYRKEWQFHRDGFNELRRVVGANFIGSLICAGVNPATLSPDFLETAKEELRRQICRSQAVFVRCHPATMHVSEMRDVAGSTCTQPDNDSHFCLRHSQSEQYSSDGEYII